MLVKKDLFLFSCNKDFILRVCNFLFIASLITQQIGYAASNSIAKDILSPNSTAFDFTFNDDANSNIYLNKTYIQVDEVLKEVAKINNMLRSTETAQCNELGCPLDSLPCEYISTPAVCAEGNLNGILCTLDSTTKCPTGYTKSTTSCKNGMIFCEKNACPSGTNLPSDCDGNYPNEWLKGLYLSQLNKCPDQIGYDWWLNIIAQKGYTSAEQLKPEFCYIAKTNHGAICGNFTPDEAKCYGSTLSNKTVQELTTTVSSATCPSGGTLNSNGLTCDKTCSNISSYSCPNGGTLSGSTCIKTCSSSYYYCSSGTLTYTGSGSTGGYQCKKTSQETRGYLAYEHGCTVNGGGGFTFHWTSLPSPPCDTPPRYDYWNCTSGNCYAVSSSQANCTSANSTLVARHNNTCTVTVTNYTNAQIGSSTYDCSYGATPNYTYFACPYNATCASGTNFPTDCSGTYPNIWLKQMYLDQFGRCPDQVGYNYWLNVISTKGYTSAEQLMPAFCYAAQKDWQTACGTDAKDNKCYGTSLQNTIIQQPVTSVVSSQCTNISGFTNLGTTNSGICSSINNSSISGMNLETAKCEAIVPIACKTNWVYSSSLNTCVINATCPQNSQIEPNKGVCVADVTCPYGDEFECKGDLLTSRCSKWTCDSFEKCGYAYCPVGEPSLIKNTLSTCIDEKCDVTKGTDFSDCKNERCPSGFGVFEQNGQCFVRECPQGSFQENNKCYTLGCPQGTTVQGDGTCLVK